MAIPPILDNKNASAPSVFAGGTVTRGTAAEETGHDVGIVGRVVGASFAVLVAEELFASGCRLLISLTSAGQIVASAPPPYFIIIDRALRDEGTSYHYSAPSEYANACPRLLAAATEALKHDGPRMIVGASWTTDAPFRETSDAIQAAADKGILAVEMEAAALYAFAAARGCKIICVAHVTNTMAQDGADFEKGQDDGTVDALAVLGNIVAALIGRGPLVGRKGRFSCNSSLC